MPDTVTTTHQPDQEWCVTINVRGLVQVSCGCTCGDLDCGWHAAVYQDQMINS